MKDRIYSLMAVIAVMLAACGGAVVPPAATPHSSGNDTPFPSPIQTPFPSPLESPIATPDSPKPGGGLITIPESAEWNNAPQAALAARRALMEQLQMDDELIGLVSAELVDWPDACLGIQTPGVMCAQVITPGYKIILSANGLEYEFHTNETGDVVRPVTK